MQTSSRQHKTLQAIAIYEAIKGVLAFFLVIGLSSLLHHDIRQIALNIIGHYGLDISEHYPALALHWVDVFSSTQPFQLISLATAYIGLRFTEAYGLWFERVWAEWLAALSGAIYLPFEALHLWHVPSWSSVLIFTFNALMVGFLAWQLMQRRRRF